MNTIEENMLNKILIKYYGGAHLEDLHSYQQKKNIKFCTIFDRQ